METTNKYINLDEAQSETVKLNTQAGELETAIKETHYIPSQHAAERFAERVWGCTTQPEKIKQANLRSEEIRVFLNKLCTYGECVYRGKIRQYNECLVYKKDNWIVLVSPSNNKIITCYPIKLGLDEEFDKKFVDGMSKKLQEATGKKLDIEIKIEESNKEFNNKIKENKRKINELKSIIKVLENENEGLQLCIDNSDADLKKAQLDIENIIDSLTKKNNT